MLSKKHRLPAYLIPQVLKKGRRFTSSLLTMVVNPGPEKETSRFAFIVSSKIDKRAVKRNQLKRKMREEVRRQLDKIKDGYSVVFLINKSPRRLKGGPNISEEVALLRQAGIVRGVKGRDKKTEGRPGA